MAQSPAADRRNFTGQQLDETGLLFYNARYYDPTLACFVRADTVVPGAAALTIWPSDTTAASAWGRQANGPTDPQALNRYSYVQNNPVKATDPTGHLPLLLVTAAIGGLVGAGISYSTQVATNIANDGFNSAAFTSVDGNQIIASTIAGTVPGATGFLGASVLGSRLGATVSIGAATGVISGQAERATMNALQGETITDGLFKPEDLMRDAVIGAVSAGISKGVQTGRELKVNKDLRVAPFGNRTGNQYGELPHYHRRVIDSSGKTLAGQGIGRHRPWETKSTDTSWRDRW